MAENGHPKVFISYSWTSETYKERVLKLAERLMDSGVDVILDQWDLSPGEDMYAFMEQSIHEADKVLILCEKGYADKANNRTGGVGTETMIITPEVLKKHSQKKYIPVVMDNSVEVPSYLKSRYAVYFTTEDEEEFKGLCFAIFGKRRKKKPIVKPIPAWLEDEPSGQERVASGSRVSEGVQNSDEVGKTLKPMLGEIPEWIQDEGKNSGERTTEDRKPRRGINKIEKESGTIGSGTASEGEMSVTEASASKRRFILHKGDSYEFGHFPKVKDGQDEPLLWRVLDFDTENKRALLITENLIGCRKYHETLEDITWEHSDLRKWLNREFIDRAFDKEDLGKIAEMPIQNPDNIEYGTKGGRETRDRIFALSIDEAEKYFRDDMDRRAAVTPYADSHGSFSNKSLLSSAGQPAGWWWLLSPGLNSSFAFVVNPGGGVYSFGGLVYGSGVSVRPALWLNL